LNSKGLFLSQITVTNVRSSVTRNTKLTWMSAPRFQTVHELTWAASPIGGRGDGSAQRGRSVIYDCLASLV